MQAQVHQPLPSTTQNSTSEEKSNHQTTTNHSKIATNHQTTTSHPKTTTINQKSRLESQKKNLHGPRSETQKKKKKKKSKKQIT